MRRKWDTPNGKPPHHAHPFCAWMRALTKRPAQFEKFQKEFDVARSTAYKWASGECLPSGKYFRVYESFMAQNGYSHAQ